MLISKTWKHKQHWSHLLTQVDGQILSKEPLKSEDQTNDVVRRLKNALMKVRFISALNHDMYFVDCSKFTLRCVELHFCCTWSNECSIVPVSGKTGLEPFASYYNHCHKEFVDWYYNITWILSALGCTVSLSLWAAVDREARDMLSKI